MGAGALLLSSMAFVGCSDDNDFPKNKLGASFIQSITAGTDYVDLHWTITPTENVEGYKVQIYTGTIGNLGNEVTSGTFSNKTYESTFTGLQPDTKYVAATQCIPASGSGFNDADIAYFEFWTAPLLTIGSVNAKVTQRMEDGKAVTKIVTVIGADGEPVMKPVIGEDGEPVIGEDGEPKMEPETEEVNVYDAAINVSWSPSLTEQQANNINYIMYYNGNYDSPIKSGSTGSVNGGAGTGATFILEDVNIGGDYELSIQPNPSYYSWFTTASVSYSTPYKFTMPAAQ